MNLSSRTRPFWRGPAGPQRRAWLISGLLVCCPAALLAQFAPLELNLANRAELEQLKGIGPQMAARILDERTARGHFADWAELRQRVKGIGAATATRLSAAGLRIRGQAFDVPTAKPGGSAPASSSTR